MVLPGQLMFFSFYNLKQLLKMLQIVKVSSKLFPLLSNSTLCSVPNKIEQNQNFLREFFLYPPALKTAFKVDKYQIIGTAGIEELFICRSSVLIFMENIESRWGRIG